VSPVPRNSGLPTSGATSLPAPAGALLTFNEVVGIGRAPSQSDQLVFANDALVAVQLALHAVLENAGRLGQEANDGEASPNRCLLVTIGREADGLSD
jgi:hypothetical protein